MIILKRDFVLVKLFGFDLGRKNWKEVMLGKAPHLPGRLTMALYIVLSQMLSNRRVILLIGTGASRKGGLIEAEWIKKFLIDNVFKIMKKFSVFENIPLSLADRVIINRISRTDIISTTTFEEAGETARIVEMLNPDMIFLVSDPVHILRCRRDFILALRGKGLFNSSILVFCISSYIPYQGNTNIYINERKKGGAFNPNFS